MNADRALFEMMASESDLEAARRMQCLPVVLVLALANAVVWAFALRAMADLMGVL